MKPHKFGVERRMVRERHRVAGGGGCRQGGRIERRLAVDRCQGGASTLVDDLLERGLCDVSVLDVSDEALSLARRRLGERGKLVRWYVGDVLELALPPEGFDFWHDRAVPHFLSDPQDAARYVRIAARALAAGGHAVIAGFAPEDPERRSGLQVVRRSAEDIAVLFAPTFTPVQQRTGRHRTPSGLEQPFAYALLQRR